MKIKKGTYEFELSIEEFIEVIQDDELFEDILSQLEEAADEDMGIFYVDEDGYVIDPDDIEDYDYDDDDYYEFLDEDDSEYDEEEYEEHNIFSPAFLDSFAKQILETTEHLYSDAPSAKMERCLLLLRENGFTISED